MSHSLPSISIGQNDLVLMSSIAGRRILHMLRSSDNFTISPFSAYGDAYFSPDQLTQGISYLGSIWTEGTKAPYELRYNGAIPIPIRLSCPGNNMWTTSNPCVISIFGYVINVPVGGLNSPCLGGGICYFGSSRIFVPFILGTPSLIGDVTTPFHHDKSEFSWKSIDPSHHDIIHEGGVGFRGDINSDHFHDLAMNNVLVGKFTEMEFKIKFIGGAVLGVTLPDILVEIKVFVTGGISQ